MTVKLVVKLNKCSDDLGKLRIIYDIKRKNWSEQWVLMVCSMLLSHRSDNNKSISCPR